MSQAGGKKSSNKRTKRNYGPGREKKLDSNVGSIEFEIGYNLSRTEIIYTSATAAPVRSVTDRPWIQPDQRSVQMTIQNPEDQLPVNRKNNPFEILDRDGNPIHTRIYIAPSTRGLTGDAGGMFGSFVEASLLERDYRRSNQMRPQAIPNRSTPERSSNRAYLYYTAEIARLRLHGEDRKRIERRINAVQKKIEALTLSQR